MIVDRSERLSNMRIILLLLTALQFAYSMDKNTLNMFKQSMNTTSNLVKNLDPNLYSVTKKWDEYFQKSIAAKEQKDLVFFYFFTLGDTEQYSISGLSYFNATASKLKKKYPGIRFIGVLKGFPDDKKKMSEVFSKEISKGDSVVAGTKIRFFPTLFEDLNITSAPAYAMALCEETFTSDGGCDYKYLVRGAIGLDGFLDLISEHNKLYKGLAHDANSAE